VSELALPESLHLGGSVTSLAEMRVVSVLSDDKGEQSSSELARGSAFQLEGRLSWELAPVRSARRCT
jgi:hypothetical protein